MEATIKEKTEDYLLIEWSKKGVGFGHLKMKWDLDKGSYELDSEHMGIEHVMEVFKSLTPNN